jgi:hypothetical protein
MPSQSISSAAAIAAVSRIARPMTARRSMVVCRMDAWRKGR